MPATKLQYRPEVDGLRAVAVLPVILFHAGFTPFGGGFVGVDIFFVISGYLITSIIVREMEEGRFSLLRFYERRARRILPALTLVVGASIPFAWVWLLPGEMKDFLGSIVAICFFVSNFFFLQESDYFGRGVEFEPLVHTWSLAVEEQFYLLFPLILLLCWRMGPRRIQVLLIAVFVASLALAHWGAYEMPEASFYLLPARVWELALGALLALHLRHRSAAPGTLACQLLSLAGLALIAFAIFAFDEATPFPSLYALVPTLGAALIVAFAAPATFVGALLASRPLVGVGLISYSAYLWHQPLFVFSRYMSWHPPGPAMMLLLSVSALLLAYITRRFVEQPFRRPTRVSWQALTASATLTGTAFLAFSLIGSATDNYSTVRFTEVQRAVLASARPNREARDCATTQERYRRPENSCTLFDPDPSWAVLGNSHGPELSLELARKLRDVGDGVRQLTIYTCWPLLESLDAKGETCARWMREAVDFIIDQENLKNIVLSFRTVPDDQGSIAATDEMHAKIGASYMATVSKLSEAGKRVFLVLQAPWLDRLVERYIWTVDANDSLDFVAGVDQEAWNRKIAPMRASLDHLPENVVIVDPADVFCNRGVCAAIMKGEALYFDDDHMSPFGARIVAAEILRREATIVAAH